MGSWGDVMHLCTGRLATAINQITYKQAKAYGKYSIVGSVPISCTHESTNGLGQATHPSNIYETERDAINAILAAGVTRFQLADCSWYDAETVKEG